MELSRNLPTKSSSATREYNAGDALDPPSSFPWHVTLVAIDLLVLSVLSDVEEYSGSCAERILMEQVVWSR